MRRLSLKYLGYLKEAKGHAEASLNSVAQALDRFENYTQFRDFEAFHPEQAKAFKAHLTGYPPRLFLPSVIWRPPHDGARSAGRLRKPPAAAGAAFGLNREDGRTTVPAVN
jgi:hypothetical protein